MGIGDGSFSLGTKSGYGGGHGGAVVAVGVALTSLEGSASTFASRNRYYAGRGRGVGNIGAALDQSYDITYDTSRR